MIKSSFIRQGAPFLVLVVGAPFVLKQFGELRYKYRSSTMLDRDEQLKVKEIEDARKAGVAVDRVANEMLEQIQKNTDKSWKNIRGPRPGEDSRQMQAKQRDNS